MKDPSDVESCQLGLSGKAPTILIKQTEFQCQNEPYEKRIVGDMGMSGSRCKELTL